MFFVYFSLRNLMVRSHFYVPRVSGWVRDRNDPLVSWVSYFTYLRDLQPTYRPIGGYN